MMKVKDRAASRLGRVSGEGAFVDCEIPEVADASAGLVQRIAGRRRHVAIRDPNAMEGRRDTAANFKNPEICRRGVGSPNDDRFTVSAIDREILIYHQRLICSR